MDAWSDYFNSMTIKCISEACLYAQMKFARALLLKEFSDIVQNVIKRKVSVIRKMCETICGFGNGRRGRKKMTGIIRVIICDEAN